MDNSFIEEYLIAIGAKTDSQSFEDAKRKTSDLESHLKKIEKNTAFTALLQGIEAFIKAANFAVGVIKKLGNTLYDNIVGVARADMQYMKLARSMWVTKETAKSLQMAMDEMGASMDDIAWIPELRDQFFRLREEINKFSTPADADAQLKYIRSIGYDIQALMIRLKMLREWVTYYLIKYMKPFLDEFKGFIKWISDQLGGNMAQSAKKFAAVLGSIVGSVYSLFKLLSKIVPPVIEWIQALPENVKKWSAIFAAVGAAIMAGPFGIFLAAIGAAFVLLQDFVYYMNGWSSSNSMAPIWAALVRFSRGEGSQQVKRFEDFLKTVANLLDTIFKNVRKILIELDKSHPKLKKFGELLLESIKLPFQQLRAFSELFQLILKTLDLWLQGKRKEALKEFASGMTKIDFTPNAMKKALNFGRQIASDYLGRGDGNVVGAASDHLGEFWMDPTGENKTTDRQCASFVSNVYKEAGISGLSSMNGDVLASQFGDAYHPIGDGYEPQPGDFINWGHHVGIYAGNGEYIARNSSNGVQQGSMYGMESEFGPLMGYGSIAEYKKMTNQQHVGASNANGSTKYSGVDDQTTYSGVDSLPKASDYNGSYADAATSGFAMSNGFMPGEWEMATGGIPGLNGGFNMGGISIGAINIGGTNATPQEIAQAVQNGVVGAINARYQRGLTT